MAKYLDQNGSKRLVDNVKTSHSALNTKINSEMVARQNFAADVADSISDLDDKINYVADDWVQAIAVDGTTLSIISGAGAADTYEVLGKTYDLATTVDAGLMSASDKIKLDGLPDSNEFTEQVTLSGGFVSKSVVSDLTRATIRASGTSINAGSATISGDPTFSGNLSFTGNPAFGGNPKFMGKPNLSGGFTSRSAASDLSYSTIDAGGATIDASGASIGGYPNFTNGFKSDGRIRINNSAYFDGEVNLQGGFGINNSAVSYLNGSKLDACQASIDATGATINANNMIFKGRPRFDDWGFDASSVQSDLRYSTLDADKALIDTRYSTISASEVSIDANHATISGNLSFTGNPAFGGNPTFTGNPTLSGNPTFTGKPNLSDGFASRFAASDLTKSTISASGTSINAGDGTAFNPSATISGNPMFTGIPALSGGFNACSTSIELDDSSVDLTRATINAVRTSIRAVCASIDADSASINAGINAGSATISGDPTFTGKPNLSGGFTSRRTSIGLENSSINAAAALIDANGAAISGTTTFTGVQIFTDTPKFTNYTEFTGKIDLRDTTINSYNVTMSGAIAGNPTFSGNPTFTGEVQFTNPIVIANTGETSPNDTAVLSFEISNGLPRLKLRKRGVDYIFNCDTSVTGGG